MSAILDTLWHRTTVTPLIASGENTPYGQKRYVNGTPITDVHCRFRLATAQEIDLFMPGGIQKTTYVVTFRWDQAINIRDKIGPITKIDGTVILDKTLTVSHVNTRRILQNPLLQICFCVETV